ncbi:MAG: hypothetical protein ACOYZ6_01515 [Chloroflexota bacterium]
MPRALQNEKQDRDFQGSHVRVRIDSDLSVMWIESIPSYLFEILAFLGLALLTLIVFLLGDLTDRLVGILADVIFGGVLFFVALLKRKMRSSFNKSTGVIQYFRGGLLGTTLDEHKSDHKIADVTWLEMRRYLRRYGDTFQILLSIGRWEKVELTGRSLSFSECQACSEIIRNFIDPALPIKAVD